MDFSALRAEVFAAKPGLKHVYEQSGQQSVSAYAKQSTQCANPAPSERTAEFLGVFFQQASALFSPAVAESAVAQLQASWYVSTAEHHGPAAHPFSVSGLFVQGTVNRQQGFKNTIVFACAGISANNSSFPRGHIFHTAKLIEKRLHLLSLQHHQTPVSHLPAYSKFALSRLTKEIHELLKAKAIAEPVYEKLLDTIETVYAPFVGRLSYAEQISVSNYRWWRQLPGQADRQLLYFNLEELAANLLLRHCATTNEIATILFTKAGQEAWQQSMANIPGAFSTDGLHGTFLFWGIYNERRVSLCYDNGALVSADGLVRLELTPAHVAIALEHKKILPCLALSYSLLSFYYGLTLGGGFSQVDYLPRLQQAYQKIVGSATVAPTSTAYLSSDYAFLRLGQGDQSVSATALDVLLYQTNKTADEIEQLCRTVTLAEAIDNLLPEMYKIVTKTEAPLFQSATLPVLHV